MAKVHCRNCTHYREAPYEALKTGCWLPRNMPQKHDEAYLDQQQIPGDHTKINLREDCSDFEPRRARGPLWKRLLDAALGRSEAALVGREPPAQASGG